MKTDKPVVCARCASWRVVQVSLRQWKCLACGAHFSKRKKAET